MADACCRLCLSREGLLDIFNPELTNSEQLRMCILMCSGVNILIDDLVTKYVCCSCCDISIRLFKFRKYALANDKALKNFYKQDTTQLVNIKSIAEINDFLIKKEGVRIRFGSELDRKLPTARRTKRYAVHPSVFKLVKTYPKIKLPDEVIRVNCDPRVYTENLDVSKLNNPEKDIETEVVCKNDLDIFKQKFPGVSIVKLVGSEESIQKNVVDPAEKETFGPDKKIERVSSDEIKQENEKILARKRSVEEDEEKMVKKAKICENITDLIRIPERTYESFTNSVPTSSAQRVEDESEHEESNEPEVNADENDIEAENFEVSTLTANLLDESQKKQAEEEFAQEIDEQPAIHTATDAVGRKILQPRKSRPSFFGEEAFFDDSDDDYVPDICEDVESDDDYAMRVGENLSLLETVDEELTFTCDVCNKMFDHPTKLKLHKRMHKICIVCKQTFMSQKALNYHLNESCYKTVVANPPTLCLKRCDDIVPPIVSQETEFEVFCISDDDEPHENQDSDKSHEMDAREKLRISQLFNKYHRSVPPYHKPASCQENAQLYKATMSKGQATMENMYPILKYFRIPVHVKAGDCIKVDVLDKTVDQPEVTNENASWVGFPIKNLQNLSNFRQIAPKPSMSTPQQEANNKSPPKSSAHVSLKNMLETPVTAKVTPAIASLLQNVATTVAPASTQPIILNAQQSGSVQNSPTLLLNNVSKDRIVTIQLPVQPKILNGQPSMIQSRYTAQTHHTYSPCLPPKTYMAKASHRPVYQVQTQNAIPQIQNQPQSVTMQQPVQTYIQTPAGYLLTTTHTTFTTQTTHTAFNTLNNVPFTTMNQQTGTQSPFTIAKSNTLTGAIVHEKKTMTPQQPSSQKPVFTIAKSIALSGTIVREQKATNAAPLAPANINTLLSKPPPHNEQIVNSVALFKGKICEVTPNSNASSQSVTQQQSVIKGVQKIPVSEPQAAHLDKPTVTIDLDSENCEDRTTNVPAKKPDAGLNYIRVKQPWELT